MEKHFVTFYSPGTFVSECTSREMDKGGWYRCRPYTFVTVDITL
jgi:hypothetical protein